MTYGAIGKSALERLPPRPGNTSAGRQTFPPRPWRGEAARRERVRGDASARDPLPGVQPQQPEGQAVMYAAQLRPARSVDAYRGAQRSSLSRWRHPPASACTGTDRPRSNRSEPPDRVRRGRGTVSVQSANVLIATWCLSSVPAEAHATFGQARPRGRQRSIDGRWIILQVNSTPTRAC